MQTIPFTFKRGGRTKVITTTQAKVLARAGLGTYETRDMASMPKIQKPMVAATGDGLDELDKFALHELAKQRGLTLHHMLGADKVRAALRETP